MDKKKIVYFIIAVITGITIGKYVYDSYNKTETKDVFKYKNENVYMLQYGVYSSEENMINNTKNLKNYFYFKDNDGYHAIIGITKNENLKEKIVDSYKITENIYMKRVNIDNSEFVTLLDQYDNLIKDTDDKLWENSQSFFCYGDEANAPCLHGSICRPLIREQNSQRVFYR